MTDDELKKTALEFRIGLLCGRRTARGMCFAVSWPLCGLLRHYMVKARLTSCVVDETEHWFITLHGGIILDATADQFKTPDGGRMPKVYLGKRPAWYRRRRQ